MFYFKFFIRSILNGDVRVSTISKQNLSKSQNFPKIEKQESSNRAKQEKKNLQKELSLQDKANEINGQKVQTKSNWSRIKSR